ncbi:MAG: hypothetical protein ACLFP1_04200 [Candidatus Goldiibacteriota bacterium]
MRKSIILMSFFVLIILPAAAYALMAPVYPDSVPAPHEVSENLKEYLQIFYSKDSIEKVKKFYDSKTGKMDEFKNKKGYKKILKKVDRGIYDTHEPSQLGVIINTKIKKTDKNKSSLYYHDFFEYLEMLSAALDNKNRKDYEAACERFKELTESYFMPTDKKDSRGRTLNKAQAMIAEFKEKKPGYTEEAESAEQTAKKIQELMQQGKMSEAIALSKKINKDVEKSLKPGPERWDEYMDLLEEISKKHAYKTMIIIHTGK